MTPASYHDLVTALDWPMTIVTAGRSGCLVGFSTQCSIDPPRHLVCISKANHSHTDAMRCDVVAVHLLDRADVELAAIFGELTGDVVDKLSLVSWHPGPHRVPVLDDAAAWFPGTVLARLDLGDHTGLVIEPGHGELRRTLDTDTQLGFQAVKDLPPGHDP